MPDPARGEIWMADFDPTRGHEQAGRRPALVISIDRYNRGPADLAVVLPLTTRVKGTPFNVQVDPPAGGLARTSFIKCDDVRSVSKSRLSRRLGSVSAQTLSEVEDRLRILLGL